MGRTGRATPVGAGKRQIRSVMAHIPGMAHSGLQATSTGSDGIAPTRAPGLYGPWRANSGKYAYRMAARVVWTSSQRSAPTDGSQQGRLDPALVPPCPVGGCAVWRSA